MGLLLVVLSMAGPAYAVVRSGSLAALESESARLVALGASQVQRFDPDSFSDGFIVMRDPGGTEFCLD